MIFGIAPLPVQPDPLDAPLALPLGPLAYLASSLDASPADLDDLAGWPDDDVIAAMAEAAEALDVVSSGRPWL